MDKILVEAVSLNVLVGTDPDECASPQSVLADIELGLCLDHAARGDRLEDTVDYAKLIEKVREWAGKTRFCLLETLADHLARRILDSFRAERVRVCIWKSGRIEGVGRVGVELVRSCAPRPVVSLVYTTVSSLEQAQTLARELVSTGLTFCANISQGESIYLWKGAVEQNNECYVLLKTTPDCVSALEAHIKRVHPYEVPVILSWETDAHSGLPD